MAATAQSLIDSAVALGYDALSHRDLLECVLYAAQSGGGGGGGGLSGAGSPVGTVANAGTTYLDTLTNNFWVNNGGTGTSWVELISS
jgi:hypothetical protein